MPGDLNRLLTELSREEIERLLAAKNEIEDLEQRRDALQGELDAVEKQLAQLVATTVGKAPAAGDKTPRGGARKTRRKTKPAREARPVRKSARKKTSRAARGAGADGDGAATGAKAASSRAAGKKTAKKSAAKKAAAKKAAAKKAGPQKTRASKKAGGKQATAAGAASKARKRGGSRDGATLEDVIVRVLENHGEPMAFKALLEAIVAGKLFTSRSKSFDNVLRRTLSTSNRVKRVSRGVYAL